MAKDNPSGAPALAPGLRYTVQLLTPGQPVQEVWFEVLDPARARMLEADLREIERVLGPAASPSTRAMVRAGFLASHGLIHDARRAVLLALSRDPHEPTLHVVLGNLYSTMELPQQAVEAFKEADSLLRDSADASRSDRDGTQERRDR